MAINQSWTQAGLSNPYSQLYYDYPSEDARIDQDAMTRARQFSAQSAAARGQTSPRGAALNTYNRMSSDYALGKAQQDRQNRLAYTGVMGNLMQKGTQPSTMASIMGPVGQGLLDVGKKDLYDLLKKGMGKLGGSMWTSTPEQLTSMYENLTGPTMGDISGAPGDVGAYSSVTMPDMSSGSEYGPSYEWSTPDYSAAYGGPAGADWSNALDSDAISELFNTGFAAW